MRSQPTSILARRISGSVFGSVHPLRQVPLVHGDARKGAKALLQPLRGAAHMVRDQQHRHEEHDSWHRVLHECSRKLHAGVSVSPRPLPPGGELVDAPTANDFCCIRGRRWAVGRCSIAIISSGD